MCGVAVGDIGGRGTEMVSKLVKEAVQAQILRSGGRGGAQAEAPAVGVSICGDR